MKKYTITEKDLFNFFKWSFIAGEQYEKEWYLYQTGELEEIKEPDFDEWFKKVREEIEKYENNN